MFLADTISPVYARGVPSVRFALVGNNEDSKETGASLPRNDLSLFLV